MSSSVALRSFALAGALCVAGCAASHSGVVADGRAITGRGGAGAGAGGRAIGLPTPPGAGGVPRPSGAAGNLTVLDWAGFKAAVTYTFDDANGSQITNYPALQALGVPLTFFLITSKTEASDPIWARAILDGHEVSNHSMSHVRTGTGSDIDAATTFLRQRLGVTAYDMAAPFGDASYAPLARTRFLLNRGVSNGLMGANDNTDPYSLFCYIPPAGASAGAFNVEIDAARSAGKWRTVLVHGFSGGVDDAYLPVSITEFGSSVDHAKSFGDIWIDTMINVGAYWRAQKMLAAVVPATSGGGDASTSTSTWTWTLPDHFPPGRYLRVKVDGGTLTQGGAALTWDAHGYYEVALDAGSLSLSP